MQKNISLEVFRRRDIFHFTYKGHQRIAKWTHIEKFYYLNSSEEQICPKLTDQHILKGIQLPGRIFNEELPVGMSTDSL